MNSEFKPLRVSNDAANDPDELQRRIHDDGYLFFKQLQDAERLLDLRRQMMTTIAKGGWLVDGTDPMDGIADVSRQCTEGDVGYTDVYHEVYKLEAFHQSAHWPEVLDMMKKIIGRPVLPHPQKVARIWFPKYTEHTTPVHQDFVHFQGNFDTYTCWAPVGDCPIELGGLAILPGSHKINAVMDHHFSLGAGSLCIDTEELDEAWHTTDYEIGDTLIFLALTVHKALPNLTADRLRVSLDNRYQALGDPIAEHMLAPHLGLFSPLSWETIYENWKSHELKYYWKDFDMPVVPKDFSYSGKGFEEALTLAKRGDEQARVYLNRIIKRDATTEQAKAAMQALQVFNAQSDSTLPSSISG